MIYNIKDGMVRLLRLPDLPLPIALSAKQKTAVSQIHPYYTTPPDAVQDEIADVDYGSSFFNKNGKFQHDVFARYLLDNCGIAKINGMLCIYTKDTYSSDRMDFDKAMISKVKSLTSRQREEVYKYLTIACEKCLTMSPPNYIGLKSCIYDISADTFIPYSSRFVIPNKAKYDYKPLVYSKVMDDALNAYACDDVSVRMLLEEMYGLCLYRGIEYVRAVLFLGNASNGKTTILELIEALIGTENCSTISLHDLDKKYENTSIVGKLVNLGDDISNAFIQSTSVFKRLVSGKEVTLQDKYSKPFDYINYAKLIFTGNELPRANDKSGGYQRRWLIIPLNAVFDETTIPNFDPDYHNNVLKTDEALEYLLVCAIRGLKRLLSNKRFTSCATVTAEQQAYATLNDPLIVFIQEAGDISNLSVDAVFGMYQQWAVRNNIPKAYSKIEFGRQLKKQAGYISRPDKDSNRESIRVYVKETATDVATDSTDE